MTENRNFQRFNSTGRVQIADVASSATLLDLSLKGVLMSPPADWNASAGDMCQLSIYLEGSDDPLEMEAEVIHIAADRVGLTCRHIDIDSITRLRRMAELNLADPEELERELTAMIETA